MCNREKPTEGDNNAPTESTELKIPTLITGKRKRENGADDETRKHQKTASDPTGNDSEMIVDETDPDSEDVIDRSYSPSAVPDRTILYSGWATFLKTSNKAIWGMIRSQAAVTHSRWGHEAVIATWRNLTPSGIDAARRTLFFRKVCPQAWENDLRTSPIVKLRFAIRKALPDLDFLILPVPHPFYPLFAVMAKWQQEFIGGSGVLACTSVPADNHWLWCESSMLDSDSQNPCFMLDPVESFDGISGGFDLKLARENYKEYAKSLLEIASAAKSYPLNLKQETPMGKVKLSWVQESISSKRAVYTCSNIPLNDLFRVKKQDKEPPFRRRLMIDGEGSKVEKALDFSLGPVCGLCGVDGHGGDLCWMYGFYTQTEYNLDSLAGALAETPTRPLEDIHRRWWFLDSLPAGPSKSTPAVQEEPVDDNALQIPVQKSNANTGQPRGRGGPRPGGGYQRGGGAQGGRGRGHGGYYNGPRQ